MSAYHRNYMAGQNRYTGTYSPSFGAYTPHPDTVKEVRDARMLMGVGGAIALVGVFLPSWWMRLGGVGAGIGVWTVGMQRQLKAGVEEKIGAEGVPSILARCASQCIIAPVSEIL